MRRKRAGDNVVANTYLTFQHAETVVVPDLVAHIDTTLAVSPVLKTAGFTARSTIAPPSCILDPCMNGGVFVEPEPAPACSFFHLASAFTIGIAAPLATVPTVADFELSFTLLVNPATTSYTRYKDIIRIRDQTGQNWHAQQPRVSMYEKLNSNNEPTNWLMVNWNQHGSQTEFVFPTDMVTGGTYNIKIRVSSNYMKIYRVVLRKCREDVRKWLKRTKNDRNRPFSDPK